MTGTLITVAPTGTDTAASLAALVTTAKECEALGAAAIDVPAGDDPGLLRETVAALREYTGLIVRATGAVSGAGEMVVCPPEDVAAHTRLRERGVVPVYPISGPDQFAVLQSLLGAHGLPAGGRVHVELVLDPSATAAVVVASEQLIRDLPAGSTFSATGLGRATLPVMLTTLATGGHLRVGLRDTRSYAENRPVDSDMQLVARAVGFAQLAQRPPLTPAQARDLLGVPPR